MISINNYITIIIALFIFSCGGDTGTGDDGAGGAASDLAYLELSMVSVDGSHTLTISVKNFSSISSITFDLGYNGNKFTPDIPSPSASSSINLIESTNKIECLYTNSITGNEPLAEITFNGPSQPEGEVFLLKNILILDSSNSPIYYTCSDQSLKDPQACSNNNAAWSFDPTEFEVKWICFIDRTPNEATVFDGFSWRNDFCSGVPVTWE